jgi:hypothetical protein
VLGLSCRYSDCWMDMVLAGYTMILLHEGTMRDTGLVGGGFVFGWLMSKTRAIQVVRRGSSSSS